MTPSKFPFTKSPLRLPVVAVGLALLALPPVAAHEIAIQEVTVHSDDETHESRVVVETTLPRVWRLRQDAYLGVHLVELTPELRLHFGVDESRGVMIGTVADDSPAATAGLRVGDIIVAIEGRPVSDRREVARWIGSHDEGASVSVEIFREGSYQDVQATVEARDRPQLWLNSLDDSGMTMQWRSSDDDSVIVLPSPSGRRLEVHGKQLDEVMETLHERLASPDFDARMFEFNSNTEELERRIKELEQRLLELSEQLQQLEDN